MRRLLVTLALLAFAGPACGIAAAQSGTGILVQAFGFGAPSSTIVAPVTLDGQLSVSFHGDAGTGCAQRGLCGYSGTVSWRPERSGELGIVNYRRTASKAYLVLGSGASSSFGAITTAKVLAPAGCSDAVGAPVALDLPRRGHAIALDLLGAAPALLSTRCAGPLAADISSSLPKPLLPIAGLTHGAKTIDLTAKGAFAANGLAGTVSSTLVLHLRRRRRQGSGSGGTPGDLRYVEVLYKASISGAVTAEVSGVANPLVCAPLGSCGDAGTVRVQPRASGEGDLVVAASDPRQSYADLLSALGLAHARHPGPVETLGQVTVGSGGSIQADLAPGSGGCRDSAPLPPISMLFAGQHRRLTATYPNTLLALLGGNASLSVLRTRCPGPLGSAQQLAGTRLSLARLGAPTATLTLASGTAFTEAGWSVRTEPQLILTLRRVRIIRGLLPQGQT